MWLLFTLACTPEAGTYLVETQSWSTTCSLGGGGFVEPAPQYEVQAYIESETELWLDDNACTREGLEYHCADNPVVQDFDGATIAVTRVWTGAWTDTQHFNGDVAWATTCSGAACADSAVELCGAAWTFTAINVEVSE